MFIAAGVKTKYLFRNTAININQQDGLGSCPIVSLAKTKQIKITRKPNNALLTKREG